MTLVRVGLISDTHGHLDDRVLVAFADADRILHAGDICAPEVLWELEALGKPVDAVRGNCDRPEASDRVLPHRARLDISGVRFLLVHQKSDAGAISAHETDIVVFGHSHMPAITEVDGVLWVNPGSASQARRSPIGRSVAVVEIAEDTSFEASIRALDTYGVQKPAGR